MNNANAISVAFLKRQPKAAAELLRDFEPEQAAEFLRRTPVALVTPVIHEMASWPAARVLALLPKSNVTKILRELPATEAETLLRLMPAALREDVLTRMPASLAKNFRSKLAFPTSTIGAWMDTGIPFFTKDNSVNDCLELVRRQQSRLAGVVTVVDYSRRFMGLVQIEKLLTSEGSQTLAQLLETEVQTLPARATLWEVRHNEGWVKFPTLPVVDRNHILLGVLTHSALKAGTAKSRQTLAKGFKFSLLTNMTQAFFVACSGLIGVISGVSEQSRGRGNSHER